MASRVETLRQFIRSVIRGIYTVTFVQVEEVNEDRRIVVSLKSDNDILIDNVPVASVWARDEAGIVVPVERGDEGLILHAQEPLEKQIQQRGEQRPGSDRRFQLEDAIFMPMVWLDEDDVPDHESGEFLIKHGSDSRVSIGPEGDIVLEHSSGNSFRVDEDGVHIDGSLFINGQEYGEHVHDADYSWSDESGSDTLTTDPPSES